MLACTFLLSSINMLVFVSIIKELFFPVSNVKPDLHVKDLGGLHPLLNQRANMLHALC